MKAFARRSSSLAPAVTAAALLITTALPASAAAPGHAPSPLPAAVFLTGDTAPVISPAGVSVTFERPAVATVAAPVTPPQDATAPALEEAPAPLATPAPATQTVPAPATAHPVSAVSAVSAVPVLPAAPPVQTALPAVPQVAGIGAKIVAAAYAQLGVHQDCTALVSNSLSAAGIFFHGWPAGYKSLGHAESEAAAQPGDLIYYDNAGEGVPHIAVYVGGGMAIHGGWNGQITVLFKADIGAGRQYIAIGH